jgi:hypothetical protein
MFALVLWNRYMLTKKAIIEWIPKEAGGRTKPPLGVGEPPYATVVRFPHSGEPWPPPVAWSLVVHRIEVLVEPFKWIAEVHFLFDEAPHHMLTDGADFELFEGNKCVARGQVIG